MNRLDERSVSVQQGEAKSASIAQQSAYPEIAYLLSSFPALSETFIAQEILELERQKLPLQLYSLSRPTAGAGVAVEWQGKASLMYLATGAKFVLLAHLGWRLLTTPLRVFKALLSMSRHYGARSAISSLLYAAYLAGQLQRRRIRHLHAHYATEPATVAQAVHLLTGISYSFTAHAYDIYLSPRDALRYKMQTARFVVTCTAYNRQYLVQIDENLSERIHCIYHGLNLRQFPASTDVGEAQREPCILAVSRLIEKKGLSYLVRACRILKDRGYRFTLRIAGEGPLHEALKQEVDVLGLSERVSLLGAVAHEKVVKLYQQAAIVALPCIIGKNGDRDGIPNVLVEALSMGVPVVSTPISGIPELIAHEVNGLLVPPQDSEALADALASLLDDAELRHRLTLAGRKTVSERFDMTHNATRLLELLCGVKEQ